MPWYKAVFTSEQVLDEDRLAELRDEFSEMFLRLSPPNDVALFTSPIGEDLTIRAYFSPSCIDYCADLMARYSAAPCDRPTPSEAKLSLGHAGASSLLE